MLGGNLRWDRIGRVALLLVMAFVMLLYVGPARSWVSTYSQSKSRHAELQRLQLENKRLTARRKALGDPRTLEREARRLGMVRPGERAYNIDGLPGG